MRNIVGVFFLLALFCVPLAAWAEPPPYKVIVYAPPYNHDPSADEYNELFRADLEKHWDKNIIELRNFQSGFASGAGISAEIEALAEEPLVRGLVISEGLPGTLAGITALRVRRPDIFVVVLDPHEDMENISRVATLTVTLNHAARGYIYPIMAGRMGARTLVYFSIPRHQKVAFLGRQHRILAAVSRDMGMNLVSDLASPDPGLEKREKVEKYLEKAVDAYISQYGPDTAFVATSTVHNDLLIPMIMKKGGNMLAAAQSSPLLGFPEALGVTEEVKNLFGLWHEILTLEDEKYMSLESPPADFTIWGYPYPHTAALSMVDILVDALEDRADIYDLSGVSRALEKYAPGVKWLVSASMNYETNVMLPQTLLVLQDSYWLGHGYQGLTRLNIPTKYYRIK